MPDTAPFTETTHFLPLRRRMLAQHLGRGTPPATPLEQAGLLAAQLCRLHAHPRAHLERLLHDACALFAADDGSAVAAQLSGKGGEGQPALEAWLAELAMHGVLLAPDEAVERFVAASPNAYPGADFQAACQVTLAEHTIRYPATAAPEDEGEAVDPESDPDEEAPHATGAIERNGLFTSEQARVLRAIAANPDELIDLDAYAGTGKSHLVLALMDARPGRYTYIAPSRGQVEAFRPRLPADSGTRLLTQIELANLMVQQAARSGRGNGFVPTYRLSTIPAWEITRRIGLQGIGQRVPEQVLMTALEGINRWCASASPTLQAAHFDRSLPWAMLDAAPYVAAAEHVWRCMFDAGVQKGGCLSLNTGHLGKWLELQGVAPPVGLGMLLVDEAHELSPAWKQVLARHAPGVVSLGDPHQRLVGRASRWSSSKVLEMSQSVRQGSQVDGLVNQSLALDDIGASSERFMGASDRATGVRRYATWSQVPQSGARLYGSLWRLLHEAHQLLAQGARVHVHPASLRLLQKEAQAPIDAWRSVRRGESSRRWEAFVEACEQRGQDDIPALFSGGFDSTALEQLLAALVPVQEAGITLCLAQHAKNLQFDRVAMSACCFITGYETRQAHSPVRAAYLALTRGSQQLWLPGDAMEQLQLSAQRHAESLETRRMEKRRAAGHVKR